MDLIEETPKTFRLRSKALNDEWVFEKGLLFPLVSGTDVNRYQRLPERQYILFPYHVQDSHAELLDFKNLRSRYPKTASYLEANRKRLEQRESGKFKDAEWFRFGRSQNLGIQERKKLCIPRLVDRLYASYDAEGRHFLDNVDVGGLTLKPEMNGLGLLYLLGLLNSSLLRWYFPSISAPFRGGWLSANRQFLSKLPIRLINLSNEVERVQHKTTVDLVTQILTAKRANPAADTSELECKIDQLVYQLYGLTEDEIAIVEGKPTYSGALEKVTVTPTPQPEEELPAESKPGDYGLHKCGECGKLVIGSMKDSHVREVHRGRQVTWGKIGR